MSTSTWLHGYTKHSDITHPRLKFTTKINNFATVIPSAHVWVPLALCPCRASNSSIEGPFSSYMYTSLAFPETWLKAQYLVGVVGATYLLRMPETTSVLSSTVQGN